ncbi:pre-mRNA-splicing factor 18 [Diutina catenulata]
MDFTQLISREVANEKAAAAKNTRRRQRTAPTKETKTDNSKPEPVEETPSKPKEELKNDEESMDKQLEMFNEPSEGLTLQEKIDKVHYLVRQEKYKAFLAQEHNVMNVAVSLDDIVSHDPLISLKVRKFIKSMLLQWQKSDPESELLATTKVDMVKLLYKLRANKLPDDILTSLATIVHYLQMHNYLQATSSYYQMSIGNVAWPVGVKDVGMHARSNDIKTAKGQANIMISESTRRWMVSVKRLITWSESMMS